LRGLVGNCIAILSLVAVVNRVQSPTHSSSCTKRSEVAGTTINNNKKQKGQKAKMAEQIKAIPD